MPHDVMDDEKLYLERLTALRHLNRVFSGFADNPSAERYAELEQTMRDYQHLVKNTDPASVVKARENISSAELEAKLRALRRGLAERNGWPPYRVFTETTLRDLLDRRPTTMEEMKKVTGLGPKKIEMFGGVLLECIAPIEQKRVLPL